MFDLVWVLCLVLVGSCVWLVLVVWLGLGFLVVLVVLFVLLGFVVKGFVGWMLFWGWMLFVLLGWLLMGGF